MFRDLVVNSLAAFPNEGNVGRAKTNDFLPPLSLHRSGETLSDALPTWNHYRGKHEPIDAADRQDLRSVSI
jgi:hypothetical protein